MQKTEKKVERFPSHSPFSAYSSLNSSYLVDGPSWTHNPKASPGMLGGFTLYAGSPWQLSGQ